MKRFVALLTGLIMVFMAAFAFADTLDYSVLEDNSLLEVNIESDGTAFIETVFGKASFTHEGAIEEYPSYVYSDIVIGEYYSSDPIALWRLWVSYSAEKYLEITSVTIVLDGDEYTFYNVGNKNHNIEYETNVRENPHISFGSNNMAFWVALLLKFEALETKSDMLDMSMQMILHGTEKDVTAEIPGSAMLDLSVLGEIYLSMGGMETATSYLGSEMTVNYLEEAAETAAE